jgi:hypothetical protein
MACSLIDLGREYLCYLTVIITVTKSMKMALPELGSKHEGEDKCIRNFDCMPWKKEVTMKT